MNRNSGNITTLTLVEKLKQSSSTAFKELYFIYEKRLYHFIFSFTKSDYIAEEILQELFIKIWEKRHTIDLNQSFEAYIYTIARNLTYNYLRDCARRAHLRDDLYENMISIQKDVEAEFIFSEYQSIVFEIVQGLPHQKRSIYQMSKLEGKSHSEIAESLGISKKTVKNHLWKTMEIIRLKLQPYLKETTLIFFLYFM